MQSLTDKHTQVHYFGGDFCENENGYLSCFYVYPYCGILGIGLKKQCMRFPTSFYFVQLTITIGATFQSYMQNSTGVR